MQFKQISDSTAVLFAQLYVISVKKLSSENLVFCLNGLKDVRASCCASLLRILTAHSIHTPSHASIRAR